MDRDVLTDYALGALTPEEERSVVEHLKNHPDDAAFVRDLFASLAAVALDQEPAELPLDGESALLQRVRAQDSDLRTATRAIPDGGPRHTTGAPPRAPRGEKPRVGRRGWWPALAAAAVIAVFAITQLTGPPHGEQVDAMLQQTCADTGVVCEPLMSEEGTPMGMIAMRPDARLLLVMDSQPPPGEAFQAWQIMAGQPTSLGVFSGRAMEVNQPLAPGAALGITIEPSGGSSLPTMPPVALIQL